MTEAVLQIINNELTAAGINYEFGVWTSDVIYPYFVGSYVEEESFTEDGQQGATFTLDGFTKGSWLDLEEAKAKIEKLFSDFTTIAENNSAVVVLYASSLIVPTGDAELKRIQINLTVKEWSMKQ